MNGFDSHLEEKTEVIYGDENIIQLTLNLFNGVKAKLDGCIDSSSPSMLVIPDHPITKAYYKMKEQGIKIKFITDITKENLIYCRELMNVGEVRHLDEIKGNFGIIDGIYYRASAKSKESSPPPLLISSTMVAFVEQQQHFFDMLWKKSIPIKKRIKEIEEGLKREFIETTQEPKETLDLIPKIISSATEEILMIFSNRKILEIFENEIEL